MTPEAIKLIARQGTDRRYGARPLRRTVSAWVEDPAADLLLSGEAKAGNTILVVPGEGQVRLQVI